MKMIKDVMEYTMTDEEYMSKHKCQCRKMNVLIVIMYISSILMYEKRTPNLVNKTKLEYK